MQINTLFVPKMWYTDKVKKLFLQAIAGKTVCIGCKNGMRNAIKRGEMSID